MNPVHQQTSIADPTVSVAMITYNHERSIAQAIESVLMQLTDFTVELIIGEDCSPDATRDIVREYAARFPAVIRPLLHEHNIGIGHNVVKVLSACRGKYIAMLEGDDYWTDEHKIQLQVNFMEKEPGCVICHHRVLAIAESSGEVVYEYPPDKWRKYRVERVALLQNINFIQTCSALYRAIAIPSINEDLLNLPLIDWAITILSLQNGWVGFLDRCMAVYRLHTGGTWQNKPYEERCYYTLKMFDGVIKSMDQDNQKKMNEQLDKARLTLASRCHFFQQPLWSVKVARILLRRCMAGSNRTRLKFLLFFILFLFMPQLMRRSILILLSEGPIALFKKAINKNCR